MKTFTTRFENAQNDIAVMIDAIRIERGWTFRDMARETGFHLSWLCDIVNQRRNPTIKSLAKLCHALGVQLYVTTDENLADMLKRKKGAKTDE